MSQGESVCDKGVADIGSIEAFLRSLFFWKKINNENFFIMKRQEAEVFREKRKGQGRVLFYKRALLPRLHLYLYLYYLFRHW